MTSQNQQLDRLEKLLKIVDSTYVKPEDLAGVFEIFVSTLKELKDNVSKALKDNNQQLTADTNRNVINILKESESRLLQIIITGQRKDEIDDKVIYKRLSDEISFVKSLIPIIPDISYLDNKINQLSDVVSSLPTKYEIQKLEEVLKGEIEIRYKGISKINPPNGPMQHPTSIGNLPDVNIVGIQTNQILIWNGTYFAPGDQTGGSGGGFTIIEKTSGTIDNSNTIFGFSQQPDFIVINGIWYRATTAGGSTNWTWDAGALQATLGGAVGTGGEIFGVLNSSTPPVTGNFLTDANGNILTDASGNPLTVN